MDHRATSRFSVCSQRLDADAIDLPWSIAEASRIPDETKAHIVEYHDRPRDSILDEESARRLEGREPSC